MTEKGKDVIFLKFDKACADTNREGALIRELAGRARHKEKIYVQERDFSPGEMLSFMKKYCDFMVCTRLHSAVFSASACVPFFCVGYNVMHDAFMDMIDQKELYIPLDSRFSVDAMLDKFGYVKDNYDVVKEGLSRKKSDFIQMINIQADKVKNILERSA